MKKRRKNPIKSLKTRCENLWKEICKLRDGNKCQACGAEGLGVVLQVDHCFSRMCSRLFYDVRNGTTLCRECHGQKTWKSNGVDRLVDKIVFHREGGEWWSEAEAAYLDRRPFKWNIVMLEELEIKLKEQRSEFLMGG